MNDLIQDSLELSRGLDGPLGAVLRIVGIAIEPATGNLIVYPELPDIARQGGSPSEVADEYKRFFAGLSPKAIAQQMETGDTDGSASVVVAPVAERACCRVKRQT